jgi:hypothetical protein
VAFVQIIPESQACGRLADDYRNIPNSYGRVNPEFSPDSPDQRRCPHVYTVGTIVEPYFHYAMLINRVGINRGIDENDQPKPEQGPAPGVLVNFATALFSSCFY